MSLAALALVLSGLVQGVEPVRQFDFWIGEWSVLNRHVQPDGSWRDGDTTRARITPVCGGAAVLEEWAGPFRGGFQNGFSLRAWDPDRKDWALLLFWTMDGNGSFGQLRGGFRHGRGEFFTNRSSARHTRYTFSDALKDSVRWDSAHTTDAGVHWRTDWIMEFSRTKAAFEVTQDELFATDWTTGTVSSHAEARRLDWMLGTWEGTQRRAEETLEARLRCKLLNKDCLTLDLLETRPDDGSEWEQVLTVRGFEASRGRWAAWTVRSDDSRLRGARGDADGSGMLFVTRRPDGSVREEFLVPAGADRLVLEEVELAADGSERTRRTELTRAR